METFEGDEAGCKGGKQDNDGDEVEEAERGASLGGRGRGFRGGDMFENLRCSAALWVCLRQSQPSLLPSALESDRGKAKRTSKLYHFCIRRGLGHKALMAGNLVGHPTGLLLEDP